MQYSVDDLVRLAKRDNNSIRPYLYVNPKQGKHIPTNPEDAIGMCRELADIVNTAYPNDLLYVIGFAETATGIAAAVSSFLNNVVYYQNTTREYHEDEEYLYFTESHSHASDQMLRSAEIGDCIQNVDRIIFIDDEVTTGSTICKLIDIIKEKYNTDALKYSIVSILNSMTEERRDQLDSDGIDFLFLLEIPHEYKKRSIMNTRFEGERHTVFETDESPILKKIEFLSNVDPKGIVKFRNYNKSIDRYVEEIERFLGEDHYNKVLVMGTEEFMYPTFKVGEMLKRKGIADDVKIHSTTRSPIIASGTEGYPLFHRYQIRSIYDEKRVTYVYNLEQYDKVLILTDTMTNSAGLSDLLFALKSAGNKDIGIAKWVYRMK